MRIVIDLQGTQSGSRFRGIGRYSLALALAMARNAADHELWLALNGRLPDVIEFLRAAFDGLIPQERIRVFDLPVPLAAHDPANAWRRRAAAALRASFLADLQPDIVHVSSLFEGFDDDALSSIGDADANYKTCVTLYDLIPLLRRDTYLTEVKLREFYFRRLEHLRRADMLLAISESSRHEAIDHLSWPAERIFNISAGADPAFAPVALADADRRARFGRYHINRPFVLAVCGNDLRKNQDGLIAAFGMLPPAMSDGLQLVVIGDYPPEERARLRALARTTLADDALVLVQDIADADLVALYGACRLFILPSLHEGFGLPLLEAMACGAVVIGANNTSIPEVIGRDDALFDATSPAAIAQAMTHALTNEAFRLSMRAHGATQTRKFSWDQSARRALAAFESMAANTAAPRPPAAPTRRRPRLAFFSPLPPLQSGISDYSADLLPALSKHYEIEVIVPEPELVGPPPAGCRLRSVAWFEANAGRFDRLLYQMGNSPFHAHMPDLLERYPGVVVLHDFFLSHLIVWLCQHSGNAAALPNALYASHGYAALATLDAADEDSVAQAALAYPMNLAILENAAGLVVHSQTAVDLAQRWHGLPATDFRVIPPLRAMPRFDRASARAALGLTADTLVVCCFGWMVPTKLNHRLLRAWLDSKAGRDRRCHLVFVGGGEAEPYGADLLQRIRAGEGEGRARITGFVDAAVYGFYLAAADLAVQLRTDTRGESSRAVLDCLAHGLPVIINTHGTMGDLPDQGVRKLPDQFRDAELAAALDGLLADRGAARALGATGRAWVQESLAPKRIAAQYRDAIEHFAQSSAVSRRAALLSTLARVDTAVAPTDADLLQTAACIHSNRRRPGVRRLLIDVSEFAIRGDRTGIGRVVRAIARQLLLHPPAGFRVEPVICKDLDFRYARACACALIGKPDTPLAEEPVDIACGDIFLGLDFNPGRSAALRQNLTAWRDRGVQIHFIVYDLLPILHPECFENNMAPMFRRWLADIAEISGGLICISRAVADELNAWLNANPPARTRPLDLGWFHLGADLRSSVPSTGMPADAGPTIATLASRHSFLMVGTVEPRKGHAQVLAAFELLWESGADVDLVIVGTAGWKMDGWIALVRQHPELGRRLFWLEGISDEYLEHVYGACTALIAASEAEGFGLPLIEAARRGLPIIARDIPVFREVAGEYAYYFSCSAPTALAQAIGQWLSLRQDGKAPASGGMPSRTWEQSAAQLLALMTRQGHWYRRLDPSLPAGIA